MDSIYPTIDEAATTLLLVAIYTVSQILTYNKE